MMKTSSNQELLQNIDKEILINKFSGSLYQVLEGKRNYMLKKCSIQFVKLEKKGGYLIEFVQEVNRGKLPIIRRFLIHQSMDLLTFEQQSKYEISVHFQWNITEHVGKIIGCQLTLFDKQNFKKLICELIRVSTKTKSIKENTKFCREFKRIRISENPQHVSCWVHKLDKIKANTQKKKKIPESIQKMLEKGKHSPGIRHIKVGDLHQTVRISQRKSKRELLHEFIIFQIRECSLTEEQGFKFQFEIWDEAGKLVMKREINEDLTYDIEPDICRMRWLPDSCARSEGKLNYDIYFRSSYEQLKEVKKFMKQGLEYIEQIREKRAQMEQFLAEIQLEEMCLNSEGKTKIYSLRRYNFSRQDIHQTEYPQHYFSQPDHRNQFQSEYRPQFQSYQQQQQEHQQYQYYQQQQFQQFQPQSIQNSFTQLNYNPTFAPQPMNSDYNCFANSQNQNFFPMYDRPTYTQSLQDHFMEQEPIQAYNQFQSC